jgi:hypothetical protein
METIADSLLAGLVHSRLAFWIWGSVLVYAISTNVLWLLRASWRSPSLRWPVEVGRFLFYLVIPYLALGGWPQQPYRGLLSLEDMGLVGLGGHWTVVRWLEAAGVGLGWGLVSFLTLALGWTSANRRTSGVWLCFPHRPAWLVLIDVLYFGVHWVFYWGALTVALDNAYAGAFLGLGLVYVEWGLSPFWREGWRQESQAAERWLRMALALAIAVLYFLSRNFWICLVVQGLLELFLRLLDRDRTRRLRVPVSLL